MTKTAFTITGWLISIAIIAVLASKIDFATFWTGFSNASWGWLILAAIINIAVIFLKGWRWQCLMRPQAPRSSLWRIFKATVIGMAGNNVLPARGGDWFKIYLLGKWENISKSSLASVAGLDKLFDGLSIILLFAFLSFHSRFPVWVQKGTAIVSIVILVCLVISILLLLHHRRVEDNDTDDFSWVSRVAKKFGEGMAALASGRIVAITLVNSIVICLLQVATIWCCQIAFEQHLDIWIPSLVFVAINLAITIPSAPSGVGPFEAAAVLAYAWFGIKAATGLNIALMYHAVQFFPITIAGLVFYILAMGQPRVNSSGDPAGLNKDWIPD